MLERGYKVDVHSTESAPALNYYDEWNYDALISLAPEYGIVKNFYIVTLIEFNRGVSASALVDFIDSGHSVIVAASASHSDTLADIAEECGIQLSDAGVNIIDHQLHQPPANANELAATLHTSVITSVRGERLLASPIVRGITPNAPIVYKGACLSVVEPDSPLVSVVIAGNPTSYCSEPRTPLQPLSKSQASYPMGSDAALVVALQARNNARVIFSGSAEFFSNSAFTAVVDGKK